MVRFSGLNSDSVMLTGLVSTPAVMRARSGPPLAIDSGIEPARPPCQTRKPE